MKRRLIIMRHAKSSWKSGAPTDFARPLNKRGRMAAPKVAAKLAELGWCPEHVLSSSSARTRETVERMAAHLDGEPLVVFSEGLYEAGEHRIRSELRCVPASSRTVMIVGHNPGGEQAVEWLTGVSAVLKTANAALLTGAGSTWRAAVANPASWQLVDVIRSREL